MPLDLALFFFTEPPPTEFYTLSLHDALPIYFDGALDALRGLALAAGRALALGETRLERFHRSEEHTSELQSRGHLVCRLLLEKKKNAMLALTQFDLFLSWLRPYEFPHPTSQI